MLDRAEKEYVMAKYGQKIGEIPTPEAIKQILDILSRAFLDTGILPSGYTDEERKVSMGVLAKLTHYDLYHYYANITMQEVRLAVREGVRHKYGDYFGISAVSVHQFVEKFIEDEERMAALVKQKKYLTKKAEEPKELTPEELDKAMMQSLTVCYNTYIESGDVWDFGSRIYNYAVNKGLFSLSLEEKQEIYQEAEKQVHAEDQERRAKQPYFSRKFMPPVKVVTIQFRARELALRRYFDYLKEMKGVKE